MRHRRHANRRIAWSLGCDVLVLCVFVALLVACSHRAAGCGADLSEPLDPHSEQHILGNAPVPSYINDPPTSGAHRPGVWPTGVLHSPMERPVQVALLEGGEVLLQYRDLSGSQQRALESLAGPHVTVAPNPVVARGGVVATAWAHRLVCRGVSIEPLKKFVAAHAGKGA